MAALPVGDPALEPHLGEDDAIFALMRDLVLELPMDLLSLGRDGTVLAANLTHTARASMESGSDQALVGHAFTAALERLPVEADMRRQMQHQIGAVLAGEVLSSRRSYPMLLADPDVLTVQCMRVAARPGLTLVVFDEDRQTMPKRLERRARHARILRAQDEERRRIARDLHDGTSQHVALAQVMLEMVRKARTYEAIEDACVTIETALSAAQHQMRTLSYVLHPPELAAGGIIEALAAFLKGFARRTGLNVRFDNQVGRIKPSADLEIALYRVAQEALVNVGKHAFASTVEVRLHTAARHLVLEIEDDGIGISDDIVAGRMRDAVGVGLSGMQERVKGLGGIFSVERRAKGTCVGAFFPQKRAEDAPEAVKARGSCAEPQGAGARSSSEAQAPFAEASGPHLPGNPDGRDRRARGALARNPGDQRHA
ncbi:sensor histidine kinase [Novosphingobium soli]|uniref:Sensor histidine kinase n=1 Tax=Novosphingobium soli TaxID=574956 RepID=A0ABV6CZ00_9SPHN